MIEEVQSMTKEVPPDRFLSGVHKKIVDAFGVLARLYFLLYQGTPETVVKNVFTTTAFVQRKAFDNPQREKLFAVALLGKGQEAFDPFANLINMARYTELGKIAVRLNPDWHKLLPTETTHRTVFIVLSHMFIACVMWMESLLLGPPPNANSINRDFRDVLTDYLQRAPQAEIDRLKAVRDPKKRQEGAELETRNKALDTHDGIMVVLRAHPDLFLQAEKDLVAGRGKTLSLYGLYGVLKDIGAYALNLSTLVSTSMEIYNQEGRATLDYHADKVIVTGDAIRLADMYRAWIKGGITETALPKAIIELIKAYLLQMAANAIARYNAKNESNKMKADEKAAYNVIFLEIFDNDKFNLLRNTAQRFQTISKPTDAEVRAFVHDHLMKMFSRPEVVEKFNETSLTADAYERYEMTRERADYIYAALAASKLSTTTAGVDESARQRRAASSSSSTSDDAWFNA